MDTLRLAARRGWTAGKTMRIFLSLAAGAGNTVDETTMMLIPWSPNIDPATIPDDILKSERARRNAARRNSPSGGRNGGRPKTNRPCEKCGVPLLGAREQRQHMRENHPTGR